MNFECVWRIENYSTVFHDLKEGLRSPTFYADSFSGIKWFLSINCFPDPDDYNSKNKTNYVSCFLNRDEDEGIDEPVAADFKIEVVGLDENFFYSYYYLNENFDKGSAKGLKYFVEVQNIANILSRKTNNILIIRCHLLNRQLSPITKISCNINTHIGINTHEFSWSFKHREIQKMLRKRSFYIPEHTPLEVTMCTIDNNVSITITRAKEWPCVSQYVTCCLKWLDREGRIVLADKCSYLFSCQKINDIWQFPTSVTKSLVCSWMRSDIFWCNLVFCFSVSNGIIINTDNKIRYSLPNACATYCLQRFSPLFIDYKALRVNKDMTDMFFHVGLSVFPAHRSVFCLRVPSFNDYIHKTMFMNSVHIVDANTSVFKAFLSYVYNGNVNLLDDINHVFQLLSFTDKYDVNPLKDKCAMYLAGFLTKQNVFRVFVKAVRAHSDLLKEEIYSFLRENLELFGSIQWQHFSRKCAMPASLIQQNVSLHVTC